MVNNRSKTDSKGAFSILACSLLIAVFGCTDSTAEEQHQLSLMSEIMQKEQHLMLADETLHQRLEAVYLADDQYNQLAASPATTAALDEKIGRIIQAEMALQQTIDSLERLSLKASDKTRFADLTSYFKATLENRQLLSDMRMMASVNSDDSTAMQRMLFRLQSEVREKNKRIAQLEQAASARPKQAALDLPATATPLERKLLAPDANRPAQKNSAYAPANGESLEQLRQRNKNLATALNAVQTQYGTLAKYYRQLKQDYDRVQNELNLLRNGANH